MPRSALPLLCALALIAAGCDSLADAGPAAPADAGKLRHWGLLYGDVPPGQAAVTAGDSVAFIVTFSDDVDDPEAASDQVFAGQTVRRRTYYRDSFTGVAGTVPVAALGPLLDALQLSGLVAFVEPDLPVLHVLGPPTYVNALTMRLSYALSEWNLLQVRPWSVKRVEADASWTRAGNGSGAVDVDVYVIDGPVQHPDLNVVERVRLTPAGVAPGSALHGTHVAGIIGAVDDGDGLVGIAPGARIHALEVLAADGTTSLSTLLSAIELVTQRKRADPARPVVASMSIGMNVGTTQLNALDEAVAAAVEAGVVFVVSAGNSAADAATFSPAHAPGAIAVGATDRSDRFAASFSNVGGTVDLLAPGVDVLSTADGGRYALLSGTSMAAPHVAGSAALYLARNPSASPAAVLAALGGQARDAQDVPAGTTRRRVNAPYPRARRNAPSASAVAGWRGPNARRRMRTASRRSGTARPASPRAASSRLCPTSASARPGWSGETSGQRRPAASKSASAASARPRTARQAARPPSACATRRCVGPRAARTPARAAS
jgi:subtilisin family serine protease